MQIRRYAICSVLVTCFVIGVPFVSKYVSATLNEAAELESRDDTDGVCFSYEAEVLTAYACQTTDLETPDPLIRRLLGLPICWWSASADDLRRISGVGASTAAGLARYRDVGGRPTIEQLDSIHRIGESTATKISDAVTTECRMTGR